jgi:RNA polymerase sigma factor (sigma-70 family)
MTPRRTTTDDTASNLVHAAEIFEQYGDFIYGVIKARAGKNVEAEDLVQDFFLTLVAKPIPHEIRNIKGYIYRAITRDIIDSIRRNTAYRARIARYAERCRHRPRKYSVEESVTKADEAGRIFDVAKQTLSNNSHHTLNMRFKIGERMNINSKSVGRYISVSLKKIRQLINNSD